jgi:hypothetical protein
MKLGRILLAVTVLAMVAGLAYVAQKTAPPGEKMVAAAQALLAGLNADQKTRATFAFDSPERTRWFFVPLQDAKRKSTRKGLPLEDMTPEQKKAALALVAAGTSASGNDAAVTIMSLEALLRDQEKGGAMVRSPEWYFFTIFGDPSKTGKWGWRVEGHHLSLNFTLDGTQVVASTPTFFGANPAEVKGGKRKGHRTLAAAEDLALELYRSLDEDQHKIAYKEKNFPEIEQGKVNPNVGSPQGLPASKMTDAQRETLMKLLKAYTSRMPAPVAEMEMKAALEAGLNKIHFAYAGATKPGQAHSYRVQGPTFVIEFLNTQGDSGGNPANHIHSAWRRMKGNFGIN